MNKREEITLPLRGRVICAIIKLLAAACLARCSNGAQTVLNTDAQAVFAVIEGARGGETERTSCHANRGSAALIGMRLLSSYQNNNLGWCEAPPAVGHPRETEKPPGTPSGRNSERLRWRMKRGISTAAVRERENSASRSVSGERQRGYQRLDDVWSVYSPLRGESHAGA